MLWWFLKIGCNMPCMVNNRMFSLYPSFLDMQSIHNLLTQNVLSYNHWWRDVISGVFSFWFSFFYSMLVTASFSSSLIFIFASYKISDPLLRFVENKLLLFARSSKDWEKKPCVREQDGTGHYRNLDSSHTRPVTVLYIFHHSDFLH